MVNITAIDASNNQAVATANVYVLDTVSPHFVSFSQHSLYLDNAGNASVNLSNLFVFSPVDNCGIQSSSLSQSSFSCADIGVNQEVITVTDIHGNSKSEFVNILVFDTVSPVITVQNVTVPIDSATGTATVSIWDLLANWSDNCGIDSANSLVSPSVFSCGDIGANTVTVVVRDKSGNLVVKSAVVTITGASLAKSIIEGPMQICANAYNVRYAVKGFRSNSIFNWHVSGGSIVSKSFRGREIYVHWNNDTSALGTITVTEINPLNCGEIQSDTSVEKQGFAPDVARIVFWSDATKNTLVCTETKNVFFQWGFDELVSGEWVSTTLTGQTANSYYNTDIENNIDVLGYRYWCETSYDGVCWNRAYMENNFPINVGEIVLESSEVWPNPFTDQLRIKSNLRVASVEIFDVLGQRVLKQNMGSETEAVIRDLGHLAPATYMLKIIYKNGNVSNHKIVHTN